MPVAYHLVLPGVGQFWLCWFSGCVENLDLLGEFR